MKLTHRYIARIILEAQTPLFVGSGASSLMTDALVQKDAYGFPMIQGTSLAGVLRHALEQQSGKAHWNSFFGYQEKEEGLGSQVKISSAYLILKNGQIADNQNYDTLKTYLSHFENLPVRQHVRINCKGVADAEEGGLFENEVVYKGCRFLFEIELSGDGNEVEKQQWQDLLTELQSPLFRLGQGTRNGYGNLSVDSYTAKIFNLETPADFKNYLSFHPSLNESNPCLGNPIKGKEISQEDALTHYRLELTPDNFFLFNSGFGDTEVDNTPVQEGVITYQNDTMQTPVLQSVTPASSIKGTISHRTCYHYNRLTKQWADEKKGTVSTANEAVYQLFGAETGATSRKGQRGKIILDDQFFTEARPTLNILNHVAIDRFTGGALDGALFSEKVSQMLPSKQLILNVYLEKTGFPEKIENALQAALKDICKGLLPLGGMTTKGHGVFTGTLFKDNDKIYPND